MKTFRLCGKLFFAGSWLIVGLASFAVPMASAKTQLRVAYSSISGAGIVTWLALDKGLFAKNDLDVELIYVAGSQAMQSLLSGTTPIGIQGIEPVEWYNQQNGTNFEYHDRGANLPDLVYRSGSKEILLEVTVAYYDTGHAMMLWQNARSVPHAADAWNSRSPDQKLIDSVNLMLAKKSTKPYPSGCVLVLALYPDLTTAEEFDDLMYGIKVPIDHPFTQIYVGGMFPASTSGSRGGCFWWRLHPKRQS